MEWLLSPIDPLRVHLLSEAIAWHGRVMVLGWGVFVPIGVLAARFFKILPQQNWPQTLDSPYWWLTHRILHYLAAALTILGVSLVFAGFSQIGRSGVHALFGWVIVILALAQFIGGWSRGSKGGPTEPASDGSLHGDHYDMTPRRLVFEYLHKTGGYLALIMAIGAILSGLWKANAPIWMWIAIGLWWLLLIGFAISMQRAGRAYDTYQAIWGPNVEHPGNTRRPIGIGICLPQNRLENSKDN